MYCPECGRENPIGSKFCMHCGADLSGCKVEIAPKIEVRPKISVSAKAEGYPQCPNCGNVLTDRNKLFSCHICGKKVCDTCGFHYNGLKLCEKCKIEKEKEEIKKSQNPFKTHLEELKGTFKAMLLDKEKNILKKTSVRDLTKELRETNEKVNSVVFDGVITQRIVDIAKEKDLEYVVGIKIVDVVNKPTSLKILTLIPPDNDGE